MMAAFAKANGVDFASRGNDALRRVAERTVQGADNPQIFQAPNGSQKVSKDFDGDGQRSKPAWTEQSCWTVGCAGAVGREDRTRAVGGKSVQVREPPGGRGTI